MPYSQKLKLKTKVKSKQNPSIIYSIKEFHEGTGLYTCENRYLGTITVYFNDLIKA